MKNFSLIKKRNQLCSLLIREGSIVKNVEKPSVKERLAGLLKRYVKEHFELYLQCTTELGRQKTGGKLTRWFLYSKTRILIIWHS